MKTKLKAKEVRDWIALFPGSRAELAKRLGVTRMVIWKLANHKHTKTPFALLRALARAVKPADQSVSKTFTDLTTAWKEREVLQWKP